jgi:hypothetical protein
MKKSSIVIIAILAGLLIFSFGKDIIIKASVQAGTEIVTGLKLSMRSFKLGLIKTLVEIKEFKLLNPEGYPDKVMLDMPEIYVDYNLVSLFKKKAHLQEVRINLKEFTVVRNEEGEFNLDSLKVIQAQKTDEKPKQKKTKAPKIQIDDLQLKIGKVIYKDYSGKGEPVVKEYNINRNEKYKNITNPEALVTLIVVKALVDTNLAKLAGIDLRALKSTVNEVLASTQKVAVEAAARAQEAVKQGAGTAREAITQSAEKAKETGGKLKEKLKLPFSK